MPRRLFRVFQNKVHISEYCDAPYGRAGAGKCIVIPESEVEVVSEHSAIEITDCVYPTLEPMATTYINSQVIRPINFIIYRAKPDKENLPYFPYLDARWSHNKSIKPYFTPYVLYINNTRISTDQLFESLAIDALNTHLHKNILYYINSINWNIMHTRCKHKHVNYIKNLMYVLHKHGEYIVDICNIESEDYLINSSCYLELPNDHKIVLTFFPQKVAEIYTENSYHDSPRKVVILSNRDYMERLNEFEEEYQRVNLYQTFHTAGYVDTTPQNYW